MTETRAELAYRDSDGIDVTLVWARHGGGHDVRVCVNDRREGTYFEIEPEPYLALDVFYHPYFYRDFSTPAREQDRLVA